MSNLQSPNHDPEFSDIRSQIPTPNSSTSSPSVLSRRNATRAARRGERWSSRTIVRNRRNEPLVRSVQSPLSPPNDGRANKRRRMERTAQMEVEQLPMELRYCDGGRFEGGYYPGNEYSPECALRDDSSVYCTKKSRCNMILRHIDGHSFSLQKLIIRAPPAGFTSPVRAGMIFVTMDETDLLSRTNHTMRYESEGGDSDEDFDFRMFDPEPCEHIDELSAEQQTASLLPTALNRNFVDPTGPVRSGPPSSSSLWANLDEQISQSRPPPAEPLEPNATFRHKDERKKCVINFEPAISGRYILAKFFSALGEKNIDIEFIGAYGWSGRRFFPSITMR